MRIIRNGIAYDTETATEIIGGSDPHSDAWWGLYRTQTGGFFKMVVDHDGETILKCESLTEIEARDYVEQHANPLVEKYFGLMREPGSIKRELRFSRRTIIAAIETMARMTHAEFTRFILKLGPDFLQHLGSETHGPSSSTQPTDPIRRRQWRAEN